MRSATSLIGALFLSAMVGTHAPPLSAAVDNLQTNLGSTRHEGAAREISARDRALAKQWQLTDDDWVKYLEIMEGPRGVWSPGLDPITALGVQETDPAERARYADIWMRVESKRVELELAFEVERMAASQRVLGDMPLIDSSEFESAYAHEKQQKALRYRVMLFTETTCQDDRCKRMFKELAASIGSGAESRIDIFFPTGTSSADIGSWAQSMGITPEQVRAKRFTLNFDDGTYAFYDIKNDDLPEVRVLDRESGDVSKTFQSY